MSNGKDILVGNEDSKIVQILDEFIKDKLFNIGYAK